MSSNFSLLVDIFNYIDDPCDKRDILLFADNELNTALHYGANNGNIEICEFILDTASKFKIAD